MKLNLEIATNPGHNAWFVAEVKLVNHECIYGRKGRKRWWCVGGSFWLFKPVLWKEWLWSTHTAFKDEGWSTLRVMLCGFEVLLETYKKGDGS